MCRSGSVAGGAPGRIRTCDLLLRRQALYPAELRARGVCVHQVRRCRKNLARPEGFEPPTYGFEARRSIQLSYRRASGHFITRHVMRRRVDLRVWYELRREVSVFVGLTESGQRPPSLSYSVRKGDHLRAPERSTFFLRSP